MLLIGCAYIASAAVNPKRSSNAISFKAVLKVCVYFTDFVDVITIFTFVSLSILSCLCLVGDCLFFVLETITKNNKIDYKDSSKIIILIAILYKVMQS